MSLADILERIAADSAAEARETVRSAERAAQELVASARADAELSTARTVEAARAQAAAQAASTVAAARLAARDAELTTRRQLVARALDETRAAIEALPDAAYAAFLARRIAEVATGGERALIGAEDRERLAGVLPAAVAAAAPGLAIEWPDEAAPFARGCLLDRGRVRAEVSAAVVVAERRDALEMMLAKRLFGTGARA